MSETLLKVHKLKKVFNVKASAFSSSKLKLKALDGVSLDLEKSETVGLVGESGCGKTTFGRTLIRLYEADGGRVFYKPDEAIVKAVLEVDDEREKLELELEALEAQRERAGRKELKKRIHELRTEGDRLCQDSDILTMSPATLKQTRKSIQMVFQDPWASLNPRMLVSDIIGEGPFEFGTHTGTDLTALVNRLLDTVGLPRAAAGRYPHEFSGGQRQRIGIARALALNPDLIVCDEPVSALDVSIQAQVLNLLIELQEQFDLTYIFIAHDLSVVEYISDRVAVMYLGRMAEKASAADLYSNPRHPYTVSLLSSVPVADPDHKMNQMILEGNVPSPINPPSGCSFHPRCPRVQDQCSREIPVLTDIGEGHQCACLNPWPMGGRK